MDRVTRYLSEFRDGHPVWMSESRVAFISTRTGFPELWEKDLESGNLRQRTAFNGKICNVIPCEKGQKLAFTVDMNGSENEQPYVMGYDDASAVRLLDRPDSIQQIAGFRKNGSELVIMSNFRDKKYPDVYLFDLDTMTEKLVHQGDHLYAFAYGLSPDETQLCSHALTSYDSDPLYMLDLDKNIETRVSPEGFDSIGCHPAWKKDGSGFYFITDIGRDKPYVAYYDRNTGGISDVYVSEFECSHVAISADNQYASVVLNALGYAKIVVLNTRDHSIAAQPELPKAGMRGVAMEREYHAWAPHSHRMLFCLTNGTHPQRIWMYDVDAGALTQVTDGGVLTPEEMVDLQLCSYRSFDGLEIPYWLYLPQGKAAKDLPVLVEIHGGPESQTTCLYNDYLQYLTSEGIAVVAPNIRGSAGYGKTYSHMDDVEKRLDTVRDIEYLVRHLTQTGLADPKRLGVSGTSYGGFMSLSCCARLPELWACAIDQVGMFDLRTFLQHTSPYRRAWRSTEYGSLERDYDLLHEISPAAKVENMRTPMVLVHGDNDPRVPIEETEQVVDQLHSRNVEVLFLRYDDEGHGVTKFHNRVDCYGKIAAFIKRYLG